MSMVAMKVCMETMEWKRALTVGKAAVFVPTSYLTSILSLPIVHLTLLFLSLCTSSQVKEKGLRGTHHRK